MLNNFVSLLEISSQLPLKNSFAKGTIAASTRSLLIPDGKRLSRTRKSFFSLLNRIRIRRAFKSGKLFPPLHKTDKKDLNVL